MVEDVDVDAATGAESESPHAAGRPATGAESESKKFRVQAELLTFLNRSNYSNKFRAHCLYKNGL